MCQSVRAGSRGASRVTSGCAAVCVEQWVIVGIARLCHFQFSFKRDKPGWLPLAETHGETELISAFVEIGL